MSWGRPGSHGQDRSRHRRRPGPSRAGSLHRSRRHRLRASDRHLHGGSCTTGSAHRGHRRAPPLFDPLSSPQRTATRRRSRPAPIRGGWRAVRAGLDQGPILGLQRSSHGAMRTVSLRPDVRGRHVPMTSPSATMAPGRPSTGHRPCGGPRRRSGAPGHAAGGRGRRARPGARSGWVGGDRLGEGVEVAGEHEPGTRPPGGRGVLDDHLHRVSRPVPRPPSPAHRGTSPRPAPGLGRRTAGGCG